jgi:uncharacterized protein YegP (UPF0339 family)
MKLKYILRRKAFEILKAKNKQFYFVFKAENGEILFMSETYKSKKACKDTIKVLKRSSLFAKTKDLT